MSGSGHAIDGWSRQHLPASAVCTALVLGVCFAAVVVAGTLTAVGPTGASVAVPVSITGTGFNATASNNEVTFTPVGGPARTALGEAIATLDATRRRLTVRVPAGLAVGRTTLSVRNIITGEQSAGVGLDVTEIHLTGIASSVRGAGGVQVRIAGSPNVQFVSGQTSVIFGAGVTVSATTVESATSIVATIDVAASAAIGPRDITVKTSQQISLLPGGFQIAQAPPANRPPVAVVNGPYTGTTGSSIAFSSAGSVDPDGDPLTFSWTFGDGATSADPNPTHAFQSAGVFPVRLTVADGKGGQATTSADATVMAPNRSPSITSAPPVAATEGAAYTYQAVASDPDGDALAFRLATAPIGMAITPAGAIAWTPAATQTGPQAIVIEVSDGRGGTDRQAFTISVAPAVTLTGIALSPEFLRFSVVGGDRPLSVTGRMSDGSSVDLTTTTDTTYESTNAFVAVANAGGVAHSVGNGSATITARHGPFTDTAAVTVEGGVALEALDLTAPTTVLRSIGALVAVTLRGQFSDGETRDLTTAEGTVYDSGDLHVASVDASGRVTAVGAGDVIITAHHDEASTTIGFHVAISTGTGLLRGQVLDDSQGLPLAGATVALLADGGGSLPTPATTTADERGRFELAGRAGDAVVAVTKPGFTVVERRAAVLAGGAVTLLDARLTPIDTLPNAMTSAFGGEAHDRTGLFRLVIPPGGIAAPADFTLTPISAQGLAGRLPLGWSPIVAVDVAPGDLALGQAGSLTVPNVASLAANAEVTVVAYDGVRHDWIVTGTAHVGADGRSILLPVNATGQIVCLAPDDAPFVPPAAATGTVLTGVPSPALFGDVTTSGDVVPRSAPPGDQAKAIGWVLAGHAHTLPSGTVVRASVSERFDLSDQSQVVPPSFTEHLVLFARGRPAGDGGVGAWFPITPSRSYTIQELLRGVVSVDVATAADEPTSPLLGAIGGTASDASGDSLEVPPGALPADTMVEVERVSPDKTLVAVPAGYDLIAAIDIDFIGAGLAQPGRLSTPAPHDVTATDQILLAMTFRDPTGVLRRKLVGSASLIGDRLVSQSSIGTLALAGVASASQYMFLRPQQAVGFVTGRAFGADGTTPHAQTLITVDTAPFADLSSQLGLFIVAGRAGVDVVVNGLDAATHDAGVGRGHIGARGEIVTVSVTLAVSVPRVTATAPISGATNVPLDTSLIVDFSDAIDPASLTAGSVLLHAGGPAGGQAALSSDRRRLVFRPDAPLAGKTAYTLTLTGLRATTGRAVSAFAPVTFTTLDPSKGTLGVSGLINGDLPDENGLVLVTGEAGAADASAPVTATNLRTQETTTVLAAQDGSFRLRVSALIGDAIALTLRDASGRTTTISLSQLRSADGTTSVSERGGTIVGGHGRVGTVLPRALTQPGLFRLADAAGGAAMPVLPDGFSVVDQFHFSSQAAQFNRLSSLTLSESQNRFPPQAPATTPFVAEGELTVPGNFLVNASLRFTATAVDASGVSRAASGSTMVVAAGVDASAVESGQAVDFPAVFVDAPRQALQNQVVTVDAAAPAARVDLELPSPAAAGGAAARLLVRRTVLGGESKLSVVDLLSTADHDGQPVLRTSGRELPGLSSTGDYAIVASTAPIVFVRGRLTGAAAVVAVDGLPFVFETDGPNGTFAVPVVAGRPFTLHYLDAATGAVSGTSSGNAPSTGAVDLGAPLAAPGSQLSVTAEPDARQTVDINQTIVFHFSEPIDGRTAAAGIVVTDAAGARVFGAVTLSSDYVSVTFKPSRRWKFATTYRWGVSTSVVAASGARLAQQTSGEFTTFAPKVISTTPVGLAHDIAVAGSFAVVATEAGIATVDVTSVLKPAVQAQLALAGGAHGLAFLTASFTDRAGQAHAGMFTAVAAGNGEAGRLEIVDVSTAGTPASIGSASLAGGGTPNAVITTPDGRAIVAIQSAGVAAVEIGAAVPANPVNPGGAVRQRYPATGSDGINRTAVLGDRLVAVGPGGLTVLDATTLERRGGISTTADAPSVAALAAFPSDLNGDGAIDAGETRDLAVVANGVDGTLQLYQIPDAGNPTLLSVVHLPGQASSVAVDGAERLAYVGLGAKGVALVDLDGPAAIQPIDLDRNGVDDRILGIVDTPGEAGRTALALDRGLAFVADGSAGLTTVQVLPPRVAFVTLKRDPVAALSGDEESILDTRTALSTDDAIIVGLQVIVAPGDSALLALDEQTAGSRTLSFADGSTTAALQSGLNNLRIAIARGAQPGTRAILTPRSGAGASLASVEVALASSDPGPATLDSLTVVPADATIDGNTTDLQVSVAGFFSDNKVRNLTTAATGTSYAVQHPAVLDIDADGLVAPLGGGSSLVSATNRAVVGFAAVTVNRAPLLTRLSADPDSVTLRDAGARRPSPIVGILSDGTTVAASDLENVIFATSDPAIVAIDPKGQLTAVGEGLATISAISGSLRADVIVDDDFRRPASITSITLDVPSGTVVPDAGPILLSASLGGTGSLDGLAVSFVFSGAAAGAVTEVTNIEGTASAELQATASGGNVGVTASVVDPATGATRTAAASVTLAALSGDNEPNDNPASASPLSESQPVLGHVDVNGDASDTFNLNVGADGIATITLTLDANAVFSGVTLVIRSASGQEIARITPTGATTQVQQALPAGAASISVQTSAGAFGYQLSVSTNQADVTIASVSPASASAGAAVTITGTGFSTVADDTTVLFGGVEGKLVSISATQIVALVPANAVNGSLEVISGDRRAAIPVFSVGNAQPRPAAFVQPHNPAALRRDPTSGLVLDITRVVVSSDPLASLAQITAIAARLGGTLVGFIPSTHTYVMEFSANATFDGLASLIRQVQTDPLVASAQRSILDRLDSRKLDALDLDGTWPNSSVALHRWFEVIHAGEAIDAIRTTSPFDQRANLKSVTPAAIDDGFNPKFMNEQFVVNGSSVVQSFAMTTTGIQPFAPSAPSSPGAHGTPVSSIIIEPNNGTALSGILNSLVQPDEDPFHSVMYDAFAEPGGISPEFAWASLDHIAGRADVPVVNLSFGSNFGSNKADFRKHRDKYRQHIKLLSGKTLVVISAGNDNVVADYQSPAVLSRTMRHVMAVGATAVANVDGSGEGEDARADFGGSLPGFKAGNVACGAKSQVIGGSNCGATLNIAAPGEDVMAAEKDGPMGSFGGTSAAAPIVAGVAALLQSIRPEQAFLKPDVIRQLLIDTADDISDKWSPGRMIRVNALKAVHAVLSGGGPLSFYVSDNELPTANAIGGIVSVGVDPLTGAPATTAGRLTIIDLAVTAGHTTLQLHHPTSSIVSPAGEWLYAVAKSDDTFGDGIVVINTQSLKTRAFIPLSGASFPTNPAQPPRPPVSIDNPRPGLALSKDGRLLYVSAGDRLVIVNTEGFVVVKRFLDMPREYRSKASSHTGLLESRLVAATQAAANFAAARVQPAGHASFGAITMSADGRTLFAAVQTGHGGGSQPGFVLPINVDLYVDPSIQLDDYFTTGTPQSMGALGTFLRGDEPSDIAASPDGKEVYLLNGGIDAFEGIQANDLDLTPYASILSGGLLGVVSSSGVLGLAASVTSFQRQQANAYNQLLLDVKTQSDSGITLISAPGVTGAFDVNHVGEISPPTWAFPSEVVFGWNPPPDNGGRIVNQFSFPNVFAKRPFGIAVSPRSTRGVVSFFQTGNFGILDLGTQSQFSSPSMSGVSNDLFKGIVAVTPSLKLDSHLWPSRGAFTAGGVTVPSPDEALLYPGPIEYAQNGRFAVGVHTGTSPPQTIDAALPDLANDNLSRLRLNEIGFNIPAGSDVGTDPNGEPVASFQPYQFNRGGGAVTIIHDDRVSAALTSNANLTVAGNNGTARPYYTQNPICATPDSELPRCADDVFTQVFDYPGAAGSVPFYRPRGVAIQPFVAFESPRFSDQVGQKTTVRVRWRHPAASSVRVDVFDLDLSANGTRVGGFERPPTAKELLAQAIQPAFSNLGAIPVDGHRYRIAVTVNVLQGSIEAELATASVDVRFKSQR